MQAGGAEMYGGFAALLPPCRANALSCGAGAAQGLRISAWTQALRGSCQGVYGEGIRLKPTGCMPFLPDQAPIPPPCFRGGPPGLSSLSRATRPG
jgi:hypothetical protein